MSISINFLLPPLKQDSSFKAFYFISKKQNFFLNDNDDDVDYVTSPAKHCQCHIYAFFKCQ